VTKFSTNETEAVFSEFLRSSVLV